MFFHCMTCNLNKEHESSNRSAESSAEECAHTEKNEDREILFGHTDEHHKICKKC